MEEKIPERKTRNKSTTKPFKIKPKVFQKAHNNKRLTFHAIFVKKFSKT